MDCAISNSQEYEVSSHLRDVQVLEAETRMGRGDAAAPQDGSSGRTDRALRSVQRVAGPYGEELEMITGLGT